jgi:hypothetical protein
MSTHEPVNVMREPTEDQQAKGFREASGIATPPLWYWYG